MKMEIVRAYPLLFVFTVILPVLAGLVTAYIAFDNLRERIKMDRYQATVQSSLSQIQGEVSKIEKNEAILRRYEYSLQKSNMRDATLEAVLSQYAHQRIAAQRFEQYSGKSAKEETAGLAEEILRILDTGLYSIRVDESLPGHPLIIRIARNAFHILFAGPMRIPPRLEFSGLPVGARAEVQEISRFGFTVVFYPGEIPVEQFSFTADAEL